jgi:hypothetical protein
VAMFVFDPERVARVLDVLPALAALLRDPRAEGRPSAVFDGMRLTDRALYRLLANPHYPHLRESLRGIDAAAAGGLKLKELRNANLRGHFGSYLQEALLADHFLTRGLAVSKGQAGNGRNADLEIVASDFTATVEVYSPRSWQWRKDWLDDVVATLKYADISYAYNASVDVVVHGIPIDTELLEKMILDTGRDVLTQLTTDLGNLDETVAGATWTYEHQRGEITTTIEFTRVEHTNTGLDRWVSMSPPGEIYRAEPEFDDVLEKIREKAEKRQVERGSGALRGLAADVSRTGIDYELETGRINLDPAAAARAGIDLDQLGLDFIALTVPRRGKDGPKRGVRATVLFEDARITNEQLRQLFDLP